MLAQKPEDFCHSRLFDHGMLCLEASEHTFGQAMWFLHWHVSNAKLMTAVSSRMTNFLTRLMITVPGYRQVLLNENSGRTGLIAC